MHDPADHSWLKQGTTSSDEVQRLYDEWAGSYDETLQSWDYRAPTQAAELLRSSLPADAALLDAGCGTGLTGLALRGAGFVGPIDGIDVSPTSLQEAEKHGVYRALSMVNLQDRPLQIPDKAYDGVLCVGVLTYVPDTEGVLRAFAKLVKSGGRVLITQRDDLFRDRNDRATIDRMSDVVSDVMVSDPFPYLPNNPDFGTEIKVIYATMTVR